MVASNKNKCTQSSIKKLKVVVGEFGQPLHADRWHLHISINVQPVVFRGQNHRAVVHQAHVEALGVLHFGLQCG